MKNTTVIPHFAGKTKTYQLPCYEIDVAGIILQMSKKQEFVAVENNSYVLIDENNNLKTFGNADKPKKQHH